MGKYPKEKVPELYAAKRALIAYLNDHNIDPSDTKRIQTDPELRKLVYTDNVTTLLQDGLEKVLEGLTSFNEIYKLIEIDDELDSHYSEEMLGHDVFTEELDKNVNVSTENNQVTDKPAAQPTTPPATTEDDLSKTEVLDLGTMN